ncbi:probable lipopolysaccharide biosynthesis protein. Putative oxidoreductase [Tenacibaculum maritimum]|uniref:aldo/keto reductase n=1 Tax=Tenacibaculum maritimum TaxID=107401 RepID=UPI0012E6931C|nr:aldo/keto reductase [Tenacibaculum maritimum]CAA0163981.1 probable lipopolysaccharide biosynthesis protein. Putative oxidoreductase [Tenacibaculum maritimum]
MINNKLILGTVQLGLDYGINNTVGKPSRQDVKIILDTAYNNGIQLLDTAEAYGDSQERIGEYHRSTSNKFQIITKFNTATKNLPFNIKERVKRNIETLNVSNLYCYMFHSFADFDSYFSSFEKDLYSLKEAGLVFKIGVSVYTNEEFEKVLAFKNIDLIQLPFNLLDNISKRGDILSKARKKGIEIHARSAFLQGLFFKNPDDLTGHLNLLKTPLKKLQDLCSDNYKMNDLALNYVYSQKHINHVLIGVDTVRQLQDNLASISKAISRDQIQEIDHINIKETGLLNPSNWNL